MENKNIFYLLRIVDTRNNVGRLIYKGLSYDEVSSLIKYCLDEKLLSLIDNRFELTVKGNQQYKRLSKTFKDPAKENWIKRDEKNRVDKLSKDSIFVPSQNELTFLDE